ncbi:MAG: retroviral-like aspartic protease family protein [Turicibacter sp.]|nr:retroviral-like aspartic protease family protein [Turicibacter sp.]
MTNDKIPPIILKFAEDEDGKILTNINVLKADHLSHGEVEFKVDTGATLTIINHEHLANLGYTQEFLQNCPRYTKKNVTTADGTSIQLRYLPDISLMFEDSEIQQCEIYFSLESDMRTLFGTDILQLFNIMIDYDSGEVRLYKRNIEPVSGKGQPQVYSLD